MAFVQLTWKANIHILFPKMNIRYQGTWVTTYKYLIYGHLPSINIIYQGSPGTTYKYLIYGHSCFWYPNDRHMDKGSHRPVGFACGKNYVQSILSLVIKHIKIFHIFWIFSAQMYNGCTALSSFR